MNNPYPHEIAISDVYISPIIIVLFVGFFLAVFTIFILNKLKISKYFMTSSLMLLSFLIFFKKLKNFFCFAIMHKVKLSYTLKSSNKLLV